LLRSILFQLGAAAWCSILLAYILTNLQPLVSLWPSVVTGLGGDQGLCRDEPPQPGLAIDDAGAFLSLAGMPPFRRFRGQGICLCGGVQAQYVWLVIVGISTRSSACTTT
jgi:NADH:ubiquinone oxidoreductase subunit 2 (subunit N)